MTAEERVCEQSIGSIDELKRSFENLAKSGESKAVMLWWYSPIPEITRRGPFVPDGTFLVQDARKVTFFELTGGVFPTEWPPDKKVSETFLNEEARQAAQIFPNLFDGSPNGSYKVSKIFDTCLPELKLQVVFWEEWWQMMGGAHVGGTEKVWLINHPPLQVVRHPFDIQNK